MYYYNSIWKVGKTIFIFSLKTWGWWNTIVTTLTIVSRWWRRSSVLLLVGSPAVKLLLILWISSICSVVRVTTSKIAEWVSRWNSCFCAGCNSGCVIPWRWTCKLSGWNNICSCLLRFVLSCNRLDEVFTKLLRALNFSDIWPSNVKIKGLVTFLASGRINET